MPPEEIICAACEEGTCETHQRTGGNIPTVSAPGSGEGATKQELSELRRKTAKAVKRLNSAIKRSRQAPPPPDPAPPVDDIPVPALPPKRQNPALEWAFGMVPRKKK